MPSAKQRKVLYCKAEREGVSSTLRAPDHSDAGGVVVASIQSSTKACPKCGENKPREAFALNRRAKDGLFRHCRVCAAALHADNREARRAVQARYRAKHREQTNAKAREKYHADLEASRARNAQRALANPERVVAANARYYLKHKQKIGERTRRYREANPDKRREMARVWREANRERFHAYDAIRRARELGAESSPRPVYLAYLKWARTARGLRCYWCKAKTKVGERHIDHIIPLSKGGSDSVANLCVACPRCNLTKSAKSPENFSGQSELRLA